MHHDEDQSGALTKRINTLEELLAAQQMQVPSHAMWLHASRWRHAWEQIRGSGLCSVPLFP